MDFFLLYQLMYIMHFTPSFLHELQSVLLFYLHNQDIHTKIMWKRNFFFLQQNNIDSIEN